MQGNYFLDCYDNFGTLIQNGIKDGSNIVINYNEKNKNPLMNFIENDECLIY